MESDIVQKEKTSGNTAFKRRPRRSSHCQYKRSIRRSPTLEENELKRQYTEQLEGLIVNPGEILENQKVEAENQYGFSDETCEVFIN